VVAKELFTASKLVTCQILSEWHQSIVNALWYFLANCNGMYLRTYASNRS